MVLGFQKNSKKRGVFIKQKLLIIFEKQFKVGMMLCFVLFKRFMGCFYEILVNLLSDVYLNKCIIRYMNVYIEIKNVIVVEIKQDNYFLIYKFSYYDMIQMFFLLIVVV